MNTIWKVSHVFQVPMEYESGPTTYSTLGATFVFKDAKISQVDHQLTAQDSLLPGEIAEISTRQLDILWDTIIYVSGHAARNADRSVQCLGIVTETTPPITNLRTMPAGAAIRRRVRLPDEAKLNSTGRLHAWLRLANESRPPASAVDAIRNYYMIWEDMHSNGVSQGSQEQELKFIRHFVSHGAALQDRKLIEFLEREIQPGTRQYDPSNQSHRAFIERRREWARRLVEDQVNGYLS